MPALQIHDLRVLRSGYFRALLRFHEIEQVSVDLVCVGCGHPVRKPGIHLQCGVLHNLRGHQTRRTDGHDLIIVAMKDEGWHIELLQSSVKSVSEKALMQS